MASFLGFHFTEIHQVDDFVYLNLQGIHTSADYLSALKTHQIVDLQPMRDLSFFLDLRLSELVGFQTYFITNLIIFIISLILFHRLTEGFLQRRVSPYLLSLFLVHPLFWRITTQVISRKYLLATMFILASLYFVKQIENNKRPLLNYSLSLLMFIFSLGSHPLLAAVPALFLVENFTRTKRVFPESKGLIAYFVLIFCFTLPWLYFYHQHASHVFDQYLGFSQISLQLNPLDQLLALGRYFVQLFLPISFAEFYDKWSWLNFLGVVLIPLFYFGILKVLSSKTILYFSAWVLLGILLPLISIDSLFIRDGYFFFSAMGFIALLESVFEKFKNRQDTNISISFILILLLGLSLRESQLLIDRNQQVVVEYQREASCQSLVILLHHQLENQLYDDLKILGPEMISKKCIWANKTNSMMTQKLYLFIAAQTEKLQYSQKMALIEKSTQNLPQLQTAKVMAAVVEKNYAQALELMTELKENTSIEIVEEDPFLNYIQNEFDQGCEEIKSSSCKELENLLQEIKDQPSL